MNFEIFKNKYQKVVPKVYPHSVIGSPNVSVCIQTYQHVDYIKDCLDSILMQKTNFSFEILLGDDDSTDGTREICKEYAEKYPDKIRLFLHHRENNIKIDGQPTGRFNFMYNMFSARGKYIALCEGDDYWTDPLKLKRQVQLLNDKPDLIACHHWQKLAIKEKNAFVEVEAPKTGHGYFPQRVSTVQHIFTNQMRVKTRTLVFKNVIHKDFFPAWFCDVGFGDVPLSFLLGKHGKFRFIEQPMAVYRITGEGVSTLGLKELGRKNFNVQHFKNWIQIWDYADNLYNYKYHKEASKTTKGFFKVMIDNLSLSVRSFKRVLIYNFLERKLPFNYKLASSKQILFYYRRKFGYRIKRKLRII